MIVLKLEKKLMKIILMIKCYFKVFNYIKWKKRLKIMKCDKY